MTKLLFPTIRLKKMIFDFGENVRIPDMQTKLLELKTGEDSSKRIVHEKGNGKNATVSIVYEDTDTVSKFHLQGIPDTVTHITIKLDNDTD